MKQTQRTSGGPQPKPEGPACGGGRGGQGNQARLDAHEIPVTGAAAMRDEEVGAWLAGEDGHIGTAGPHPGGTYVIVGGESLADLCEQAYGTPSASGDAFQVMVAVASGIMTVEEARALRDGQGAVGPIAHFGATWGLRPGTRLFFPREPARLLHQLAPGQMGAEQAEGIEGDIAEHEAVMAIEDMAFARSGPLMRAYTAFGRHFTDVAPNEKRSHTEYVKFELEQARGFLSGSAKYDCALTVTREADGTWSAERSLSESMVVLVGRHFAESVETTNAASLAEALGQLDVAEAIAAALDAGHDVTPDVLEEVWTGRFGPEADLEHRKTRETLDVGLYYGDGDLTIGAKASGETARKRSTITGADGRKQLGSGLEYASKFEASVKEEDVFEAKATLDAERVGDESNRTKTKVGVEAKVDEVGLGARYEKELGGDWGGSYTLTLELDKLFGEAAVLRFARATERERVQGATPYVDLVCDRLEGLGVEVADRSAVRSAIGLAPGLTAIKLTMTSAEGAEMTLVSDPGMVSVPGQSAKAGAGDKIESTYVIAKARR